MNHEYFMNIALDEAKKAFAIGEVPVGAVLVINNEIVAKAHNLREKTQTSTHHAEILAIEGACKKIGFWRLNNSYLYSAVEPCVMCSGAIILSRIENLVYGAKDKKNGCCDSVVNLVSSDLFNHKVNVTSGVLEEECSSLMKDFFRELREKNKTNLS